MPLPSAEVHLDRAMALAVLRQVARHVGGVPTVEDYEGWAKPRRTNRPDLVDAAELVALAGATTWNDLCAEIRRG